MREQFNLGFVDVGGWDTHVNQGAANGYLADRLGELGRALAGLSEEIGPDGWRDTVVVVISEFGRTFRENGDRGTDHGHGSVYWVMGGGINGGRILGEQVKVDQANLFSEPGLPGSDRLSRDVRRAFPAHVRARCRERPAHLCRRASGGIGLGITGFGGHKSAASHDVSMNLPESGPTVTFLATIENHGLAMNTLAVISILALLTITGAAYGDQLWTGDQATVQGAN